MQRAELIEAMKVEFLKRFPNSHISFKDAALCKESIVFYIALGNGRDEWNNGIFQNDLMSHCQVVHSAGANIWDFDFKPCISHIKPENPHKFCDSTKISGRQLKGAGGCSVLSAYCKQLDKLKAKLIELVKDDKLLQITKFDISTKI